MNSPVESKDSRRGGRRSRALLLPLFMLAGVLAGSLPQSPAIASAHPPWMLHVLRYPGGFSAGARAVAVRIAETASPVAPTRTTTPVIGTNVQMNTDTTPPTPQNDVSVAYDAFDPTTAVAATTDFGGAGFLVMRTTDGGLHWSSASIGPIASTGACFGFAPWVAFSRRDRAFYLSLVCTAGDGTSEIQLLKSVNDGRTWTPTPMPATVQSNVDPATGDVDTSFFYDKGVVAIDNSPSSPHYGRIYVGYLKFHLLRSGLSDYCPAQVAYTDRVPTRDPSRTVFSHTAVVPDDPGDNGKGASANQDAYPVVEKDGTLDLSYILEDCNSFKDRHLELQKSSDGGATFLADPIRIDRPGEFVGNPHLRGKLPPTKFPAQASPSFAVNAETGDLAYAYMNDVNEAQSGTDISIQFSSDGGRHWTHARSLSVTKGGAPAPQDQFFPAISADPAGRWHAIWLDRRRDDDNVRIDTFQADWTGTPSTFRNRRISTRSWNPNHGFFSVGGNIGGYSGLASANSVIYPAWTDGRNSAFRRTGIGETDIFTNVEIRG
jgi:hypothetical protein